MSKGFIMSSGDGTSLNYNVVGGTTQPTNASENTIWVNTDVEITVHAFLATEPASPVVGMVWFNVGTSSTTPINALKKNTLMVYPVACQQYISGAWVTKEAKTYQGGEWVNWAFELLKNGQFSDGYSFNLYAGAGAATTVGNHYVIKETGVGYATFYLNTPVDVSAFSSVSITADGGRSRYPVTFGFVIQKKEFGTTGDEEANIFDVASTAFLPVAGSGAASGSNVSISPTTQNIDLSNISGLVFFGCTIAGTSHFTDATYGRGGIGLTDMVFNP